MSEQEMIIINSELAIPANELQFRFSTSSGPGGQHANRAATRVTLLFDVTHSPSLDEASRGRLLEKLSNRLDKQGVLQISVQDSRSQRQNRATAVFRFQELLAEALREPKKRHKTKPTKAAKEKRLADKKKRGLLKEERQKKWPTE